MNDQYGINGYENNFEISVGFDLCDLLYVGTFGTAGHFQRTPEPTNSELQDLGGSRSC